MLISVVFSPSTEFCLGSLEVGSKKNILSKYHAPCMLQNSAVRVRRPSTWRFMTRLQPCCCVTNLAPGGKCRPGRSPPPCPPSHHAKAKPLLMLLTERNVRKICSCYLGCFSGLEGPVLSGLTENDPKSGPNCIGTPFWSNWDQEGSQTQEKPAKKPLNMVLCAG